MKICLVTNAHISYNPRLVKEADALSDAGYDIEVVSVTTDPTKAADDDRILASRRWRCRRLNFAFQDTGSRVRWAVSGLRAKTFKGVARLTSTLGVAELAFCRYLPESLKAARRTRADLYVAHNLQALPVVAAAAAAARSTFAFDIEDFHIDEDSPGLADARTKALKANIMRKYLSHCAYLTVTSEAMAIEVERQFAVARPRVLYNVFPLSHRNGACAPNVRERHASPRAYWFSHVVSMDRGLQDFIQAMPLFIKPVELHLRGCIRPDASRELVELSSRCGVSSRVLLHPVIHADDIVADAANYDIGLALEQPVSLNRLITATNKIFTYLLAGIAVVASDTPGQREVLGKAPGAGVLYEPGDIHGLARAVNRVLTNDNLESMKQSAWDVGSERFNWDLEKQTLLATVRDLKPRVR